MTINVLIVDDSPSMQQFLRHVLQEDPEIRVAALAGNANEARDIIKSQAIDVVTLDVEMPGMNGIDFLERLMRARPMPVVMISTLTDRGTRTSIEALSIGAFSCLPKPRMGDRDGLDRIRTTVKEAARASDAIRRLSNRSAAAAPAPATVQMTRGGVPGSDVIVIGASTGGVEALKSLLVRFPADCPPTVIAQHMLPGFTRSLAEHLDRLCQPTVREAVDQAPLQRGIVYLAPSGQGHTTLRQAGGIRTRVQMGEPRNRHMPSVDELFESCARISGITVAAALLTGMGRDGAEGLLMLRNCGALTVAQDENTSLIYGMPRVAAEMGAAVEVLPLDKIAGALLRPADWRRTHVA